jgi:hypothetical protein
MLPFHMAVSKISAGECRTAEAAGKRRIAFRTRMQFGVSFEVLMAREATVTDIALEWLFSANCCDGRHRVVAMYVGRASAFADQWNEA